MVDFNILAGIFHVIKLFGKTVLEVNSSPERGGNPILYGEHFQSCRLSDSL